MLPIPTVLLPILLSCLAPTPCQTLVSGWGEACNFTAECSDHRLVCSSGDEQISRCICDRFHEWQGATKGCVQKYAARTILNMTMVSRDNEAALQHDAAMIFVGQKVAGVFVMSVALLCPLAIAIHCFHMRRKDGALKREVAEVRERVDKSQRDQMRKTGIKAQQTITSA